MSSGGLEDFDFLNIPESPLVIDSSSPSNLDTSSNGSLEHSHATRNLLALFGAATIAVCSIDTVITITTDNTYPIMSLVEEIMHTM